MKKILIDAFVPYVGDIFDGVGEAVFLSPDEFTQQAVARADALIVRTRTRCAAPLLEGSHVSFVGTATIGTDHLDLPWLSAHGIEAVNAPGCNAPAVAQYVLASIYTLIPEPEGLTVAVVGVGHVGSVVADWCRKLGMEVLLCDPPRAEKEGPEGFVTLEEVAARADIITFHTPLTRTPAPHPTYHLADAAFFRSLARKPLVINSARGPVFDTAALLEAMDAARVHGCVIDCWEGEPAISPELLARADIATPHIAGYSLEGKIRATRIVLDAITNFFYLPRVEALAANPKGTARAVSPQTIIESYNPLADTLALKAAPQDFEALRNNYHYRSEPTPARID